MKLRWTGFDGPVWRLVQEPLLNMPLAPARAPEGRFHYDAQLAVYASLSPEGAEIAIKRYVTDGVARVLVTARLTAERVADVRDDPAASVIWQDVRGQGLPAPTWAYSDAARAGGAQAMLYTSRSRPDLSHVVVFNKSCLRLA